MTRLINWLFNLEALQELVKVKGLLEVEQAKVAYQKDQILALEDEKRELLEWVIANNGGPSLYGRQFEQPTPPQQASQHQQRLNTARTMRDWVRAAEQIESEAAQLGR